MSQQERTKKERALARLGQDIQRLDQELRVDGMNKQQEEMGALVKQIREAASKLAEKENYSLIITEQMAIYSADAVDVTGKVLANLKK